MGLSLKLMKLAAFLYNKGPLEMQNGEQFCFFLRPFVLSRKISSPQRTSEETKISVEELLGNLSEEEIDIEFQFGENMEGVEEVNIEELASNLSTYREQLEQVRQLLSEDPRNSEYADMEKELKEVIALTEELLATAKQNDVSLSDAGVSAGATAGSPELGGAWEKMESRNDPIHENKFPVGTKVQAVFSEDGEWYDATVEAHTVNGYYVSYDEWGNKEEVDPDNVRPIEHNALLEAERVAEATRNALKRKIEQAAISDFQTKTLPAKLKIDPNDPEDVKIAKRKKIHAFKSKARQEQLEVVQNKKQNAWQQFQTTKAKTKKVGFFTGRKKESIFKSPEDPFGKVGVTGSGKGLTDFQKREKHLHLKSGNAEGTDE